MTASGILIVLSTVPDESRAADIAKTLVEERWAACVNRLAGVRSTYRWEGKLCDEAEFLLIMKTTAARVEGLIGRLKSLHPYAVPEIVAVPIVAGHPPYLAWIAQETEKR